VRVAEPDAEAVKVVILVVDDDPDLLYTVGAILEDPRTEVLTAASGLHALRILEAREIDVILSDEVMPGMNGVLLLETVCKRWPRTVRALFTGHPWPDTLVASVNRAAVHKVLVKPMEPQRLRDVVFELVSECLARRGGS